MNNDFKSLIIIIILLGVLLFKVFNKNDKNQININYNTNNSVNTNPNTSEEEIKQNMIESLNEINQQSREREQEVRNSINQNNNQTTNSTSEGISKSMIEESELYNKNNDVGSYGISDKGITLNKTTEANIRVYCFFEPSNVTNKTYSSILNLLETILKDTSVLNNFKNSYKSINDIIDGSKVSEIKVYKNTNFSENDDRYWNVKTFTQSGQAYGFVILEINNNLCK